MERALKRIEENIRSRNTFLDHGNCDLKNELPKELMQCTWLTGVSLGDGHWDEQQLKHVGCTNRGFKNTFTGEELKPLENLPALKQLDIFGAGITNIRFIDKCKNLQRVNLYGNKISDLSPLSKLPLLSYLNLGSNNLFSIRPLEYMYQLRELYLFKNNILNLEPFVFIPGLERLTLGQNGLRDIYYLSGLKRLQYLSLEDNKISDIGVVKTLTNLRNLDLSGNRIHYTDALHNAKKLETLNLAKNKISYFDEALIKNLPSLTTLYIYNNPVSNIPLDARREWNCLEGIKKYIQEKERLQQQGKTRTEATIAIDKQYEDNSLYKQSYDYAGCFTILACIAGGSLIGGLGSGNDPAGYVIGGICGLGMGFQMRK